MNRDEITRKTSELSTPDTPAISLLKTVIQRKKKWHFSGSARKVAHFGSWPSMER